MLYIYVIYIESLTLLEDHFNFYILINISFYLKRKKGLCSSNIAPCSTKVEKQQLSATVSKVSPFTLHR